MKYPLYELARHAIRLPSGRAVDEFSLQNLEKGLLSSQDLGIHREVLLNQAQFAERAGFPQLGENLRRAAELTKIPDDELLRIYDALRPGRMKRSKLLELAQQLEETYGATRTAEFIREAAYNCVEETKPASSK
jgi:propanediol dehydratase small subunit